MMELRISPAALEDMKDIRRYIEDDLSNADAASRLMRAIVAKMRSIADYPQAGSQISRFANIPSDIRFMPVQNYFIFYRTEQEAAYILRVIYGRRDYIRILFASVDEDRTKADDSQDKSLLPEP
ncbi:type II toxin-antitoxin system RelE/ParE family toxin [Paenibacillus sp. B01]|uniref:type II toxin-antitoxin system RelE/ParE family toxin n=1 Tax=Paenibacillus sp. B01 TaxID=2660554 RepID=UPI001E353226|nr:type II toxin-antitoxin system RelE/ParE family toxin [Paenibacillus sp. B01]